MFGAPDTDWQASLQPASYAGVPFFVLDDSLEAGRRVALHQYPFRNTPWAEDLGRRARKFRFTAFLIGDLVIGQRNALLDAIEAPGPGTLIHPSLPNPQQVQIELVEMSERWDKGRMIELRLAAVEAGQVLYPTTGADTQAAVGAAADAAATGIAGDYTSAASAVA
jgi:prophage DNA circulation protein